MRVIVYELPVRLFANGNPSRVPRGSLAQNGAGRFEDINDAALQALRSMGVTHLWLVGVLRQATATSHPGLPADPADVVKGVAGSFFAVRDYFDVCPDYARQVPGRMKEFEALVERIHAHGLKVLLDLVPNHVARCYRSVVRPELDFGLNDDRSVFFSPSNSFFYLVQPPGQRLSITAPGHWQVPGMTGSCPWEDGVEGRVPKVSGNNQTLAAVGAGDWYDTVKLNYGYNFVTMEKRFEPIPPTWWKVDEVIGYWQGKGWTGSAVISRTGSRWNSGSSRSGGRAGAIPGCVFWPRPSTTGTRCLDTARLRWWRRDSRGYTTSRRTARSSALPRARAGPTIWTCCWTARRGAVT
jgi:hypothetical protein